MEASRLLHELLQDEAGVTAIEYALMGSLIAMAIVVSVTTLGLNLRDIYAMVAAKVQCAISGVGCLP
jgi:pilus assembly protein Flp/PilA